MLIRAFAGSVGALVALVVVVVVVTDDPIWLLTYGPLALAGWWLLALAMAAGLVAVASWYEERCARARRRSRGIPVAVLPPELPDEPQLTDWRVPGGVR